MAELNIFPVFLSITGLFMVFLLIKEFLSKRIKKEFCVICLSVSIVWITLLILYFLEIYINPVIIALLLGQSVLGIFYLVESKVKKELRLFRLPFLLTLTLLTYLLIRIPSDIIINLIFIIVLWLIFIIIHYYRKSNKLRSFTKKIIECCRNW